MSWLLRGHIGLLSSLYFLIACGAPAPLPTERAPDDPVSEVSGEDLYNQGLRYAQSGDLLRAEQYLATAISRGHDEERTLKALVSVCVAGSRLRAALRYALPYLRRNPTDWSLRYLVASIHLGLNEPDRARQELDLVIELAPDAPDAHFLLAELRRDHDADIAGAAESFRRYLALAPEGERAAEAHEALRRMNRPIAPSTEGSTELEPEETAMNEEASR